MKVKKIFIVILTLLILGFMYTVLDLYKKYDIDDIKVNNGDSIYMIYKRNNIKYTIIDKIIYKFLDSKSISSGIYETRGKITKLNFIKTILNEKPKVIKLVIPEGSTTDQIFLNIEKFKIATKQEILEILKDYDFYYKHSENFEGYFYPATYEFNSNVTAKEIIDKILNEFLNNFPPSKYKDKDSFYNNLILASIVERETQDENEVEKVAGVFKHRLSINKRLESDATLRYVLPNQKQALKKELQTNMSKYNTYRHAGLTPTPISNPSKLTILKTMNAKIDENLYFFARNGKIYYSKTHEEHLRKRNSEN